MPCDPDPLRTRPVGRITATMADILAGRWARVIGVCRRFESDFSGHDSFRQFLDQPVSPAHSHGGTHDMAAQFHLKNNILFSRFEAMPHD